MTQRSVTTKGSGSRLKIFGEIISELKKVVWLTRREAMYLTFLVLVIAVVAGIILGALDFGFTKFIDQLFVGN